MYTITNIIEELNNRGYNAQTQVVTKNGVELNSVVIRTEGTNIAPNIYVDEILERVNNGNKDFDLVISEIIKKYEEHKNVSFNAEVLKDKDFILSHSYIALQRASEQELVKRDCGFDGIESYLYMRLEQFEDGIGAVKLNHQLLALADISEDELWKSAEKNTFSETTLKPLFSAISDILEEDIPQEILEAESCGLYVLSNKSMNCGASAILDKKALNVLAEKTHTRNFIMIPSSRHEVIVVPETSEMRLEDITEMVQTVNANEVRPIDQLADKAYRLAI